MKLRWILGLVPTFVLLAGFVDWQSFSSTEEKTASIAEPQQADNLDIAEELTVDPDPVLSAEYSTQLFSDYQISEETLDVFNSIIFTFSEQGKSGLLAELRKVLEFQQIAPDIVEQVLDLFARYIDFKAALAGVEKAGQTSLFDPDAIAGQLQQVQDLRLDYFTQFEISALFAEADEYDELALQRLRVSQDKQLTTSQQHQLIADNIAQLPEAQQQAFAPSLAIRKLNLLREQTRGDNPELQYQTLAAEFGEQAGARVAKVWQKQQRWIERVQEYQSSVSAIQGEAALTEEERNAQISELKQSQFNAGERKRLEVYIQNPELLKQT